MSERDYLSGVPFILGKRFYPVPRVQFREIDNHIPVEALQDEFDFSFERNTIRSSTAYFEEKRRLAQEAEEKRRREEAERIAAEAAVAEARAKAAFEASQEPELDPDDSDECRAEDEKKGEESSSVHTSSSISDPPDLAAQAHVPVSSQSYSSVPNGLIHPPPPQHSPFTYQNSPYPVSQQSSLQINLRQIPEPLILKPQPHKTASAPRIMSSSVGQVRLNLSDFEADAASPFDSVALTSLDDRSELEEVWANNMNLSGLPPSAQTSQPFIPDGESLSHVYPAPTYQTSVVNGISQGGQISTSPMSTPAVIPPSSYYLPHQNPDHLPPAPTQPMNSVPYPQPQPPQPWTGYYLNSAQTMPTTMAATDSFTRVQFPFLSSLPQNNDRGRQRIQNRIAERHYHELQQHLNYQQSQPPYPPITRPIVTPLITSHLHARQPVLHPSDIQSRVTPGPRPNSNVDSALRHPVPPYWHPGGSNPTQRFQK